jgi:serine/threonine protein kinase
VVHRARCKESGAIFALKKLKLESFREGFPQTSVREMNVLLALHHPNIVNVSEVCAVHWWRMGLGAGGSFCFVVCVVVSAACKQK